MTKNKLGIIIPYRDRYEQLIGFKKTLIEYLNSKGIDFELIVVEQDDAKIFNRGKLLNIGFIYAKKLKCNYVVFHDVDMLPLDVDYSYSEIPLLLASNFKTTDGIKKVSSDQYFSGVTLFPIELFEKINGYSNEYWGWGYEDDDMLYRCQISDIPLDKKEIPQMGGNTAALKFNGENAYVKGRNVIGNSKQITFFVTFYPDELTCNHETYDDSFSVFTIPGFDLSINYSSYSRYNFEMYDNKKNIIYINSDIKKNYKTNIAVTIDFSKKEIIMYQDGVLVSNIIYTERNYDYRKVDNFYLGVGNPDREKNEKYFKGLISSFSAFSKILNEKEIEEISKNKFFGLTQNFGEYQSSHDLKVYYDAKFIKDYKLIDLSGNENNGEIVNCEMVGYLFDEVKLIDVPFKKECTFELIPHEENGYVNGGWKNITTRYNQMRFHNEVSKGHKNIKDDGLNNCVYKEHSYSHVDNQKHIVVGI
jgi:predicted glycosyltransferase involved in capsule biosynthesis